MAESRETGAKPENGKICSKNTVIDDPLAAELAVWPISMVLAVIYTRTFRLMTRDLGL